LRREADVRPPVDVLVIDDDEAIRDLVTAMFAEEGYSIMTVASVDNALEVVERHPPKIIFLDSATAEASAGDVAFVTAYRQSPPPHAPIILFTAVTNAACYAEQLHVDGLLTKPFEVEELLALVRQHTDRTEKPLTEPTP